jgi:hypothetical protein
MLIVIFSRDRALQLHATLNSMRLHCRDLPQAEILVLYRASSPRDESQYQTLSREFSTALRIEFLREQRFRTTFLTAVLSRSLSPTPRLLTHLAAHRPGRLPVPGPLVRRAMRGRLEHELILFLVDDNIFVRDFSLGEIADALGSQPRALGFSLRLGTNTTYCYAYDSPQPMPRFRTVTPRILEFGWKAGVLDFGYPLEVSSSAYRTGDILPVLTRARFKNPNLLESALASSARKFSPTRPSLLCFRESVTFCNAINKIQTDYPNRAGDVADHSPAALARAFDAGYRIDVEGYSGLVPESAHAEQALKVIPPK